MNVGVLVLAAGKSSRIAPVSGGLPKPLLELHGKRLIEWNLEWLAAHGVRDAWVNLHHRAEDVRAALGDGSRYGVSLRYVYEPAILGTAGAWRNVAAEWSGTWLVVYGDNVTRFDLWAFLGAHRDRRAVATVALFDPARHRNTGIAGGHVSLDPAGRVVAFREGEPPRPGRRAYVNAGVYLLEPEVLGGVADGFQDFGRDVFPRLVAGGRVFGHVMEESGFCLGLDTPESYAVARGLVEEGEVALR
ncbi:MAG TPA: nucleotidyltransferase family protein [Longimicrobiales bacterium]